MIAGISPTSVRSSRRSFARSSAVPKPMPAAASADVTSSPRISVEPGASQADIAAVQAGLRAFNVEILGDPCEEPVNVFLRDDDGVVVGGLLGHIRWRWLYVSKLWMRQ